MNIQWFPGHIAKSRKEILNNLKSVDVVIEILDARAPISTKCIYLKEHTKKKLIILNKSDLSDDKKNQYYIEHYKKEGYEVLALDSKKNNISKIVEKKVLTMCDDIIKRSQQKGISKKIIKAMVVGMPNVGKSTFINSYVKKKIAKVENRPGVTRNLQWIKISNNLLLLDTPGITEAKFEDENVGKNLALIGSINDDILDKEELVIGLVEYLKNEYGELLKNKYDIDDVDCESICIIEKIAIKKGCIKSKNEIDYNRVSNMILNDFRSGSIGNITLYERV